MRINKRVNIGRFDSFVGYRPHWSPVKWQTEPIAHGRGFWWGRWEVLLCWLPKPKPYAEMLEELLAEGDARKAEAARSWPDRCAP